MHIFRKIFLLVLLPASFRAQAQTAGDLADGRYIDEVQERSEPDKVLHAEPLYIDLIRDLGARKGEQEWNVGMGLTDNLDYDSYTALVEYEFCPVNRLGLEAELPFTLYSKSRSEQRPGNRLQSIKLAGQYSFFVSQKLKTSMALGYINELLLPEFRQYGKEQLIRGNVYNPFFVAAKRWGNNYHTLIYTGPLIEKAAHHSTEVTWQMNTSVHYLISGTRNFIGIECNQELRHHDFDLTVRPQMRVSLADNLLVGIVAGIPVKREQQRFSTFLRLIYEPGHGHK